VGLKPSANQGKARRRGLYRIIYSKTIISVYTLPDAGASHDTAGQTEVNVSENCYIFKKMYLMLCGTMKTEQCACCANSVQFPKRQAAFVPLEALCAGTVERF
jgi:hypothetical protein